MKLHYFLYLILIIFFAACQKTENPYVPKSVIDSLIARQNPTMKNVAFIFNNDIYFLAAFDKPVLRITSTPNSSKRFVSMSHNHTKFAYLNRNNSIVIVDNKGLQIEQLSQYTDVKSFDWSLDDKTLYILNNNMMFYYGPSMNLPEITYPGINWGATPEVLSASVSSKGDFAYVFYAFYPFGPDYYKLVVKRADKKADVVYRDDDQNAQMAYVAFSVNEQDLLVGYKPRTTVNNKLYKLAFFTGLKNYPDGQMESTTQAYSTPKFNSSLDYMVGGYMSDSSDTLKLNAFGFGKFSGKNLRRSEFFTVGDAIYTDWK
jgi:hypothetical protein